MTSRHPKPKPVVPANTSAELATLKAENETLKQGWQRTQADFDNFRRRTVTEQADRAAADVGRALMALTPVAENLRRAVSEFGNIESTVDANEQLQAWAKGVVSIARQLDQALVSAGLTPIEPQPGEPFNPHEHEALTHQPHPDHGHDTVVQVIERGYRAGNRVIAPAKVIVSSGKTSVEQ